jgi:predicted CXXCH cytochrome family protein
MRKWIITGIVATAVIAIVLPLQVVKYFLVQEKDPGMMSERPYFTGGKSCIECHQLEYDLWKGSDHDNAMNIATEETVLGDFGNATFVSNGVESRFYKKNEKFFVYTEGPGGEMGEFEVAYTFGVRPLQQYLIPFEDGKLQCLPIAWNTIEGEWYHLFEYVYAGQDIKPDNWLYWTNLGQNWNGMCAECHSTNLQKNLDPVTMTYNTTWTDIDVNCEACHGPGSAHIDWANLPELGRPLDNNFGLVVQTRDMDTRTYVNHCGPCHARRQSLSDFNHFQNDFMDFYIPQLVDEPYYFNDGQILEEDYVYGSFVQSKMYMNDVKCNDCHNAHSIELVKQGNDLCMQCHRGDIYNTTAHHFHKLKGEEGEPLIAGDSIYTVGTGAECINCHMVGRYYMGVDYRRDHSFRVPRPDLTIEIGSPNACNDCHSENSAAWAQEYINLWYGTKRKPHQGSVFSKAQEFNPEVKDDLIRICTDDLYPEIVRATAISLSGNYFDSTSFNTLNNLLTDPEPLVRYYALRHLPVASIEQLKKAVIPLLYDPVRAVRGEAAMQLSILPDSEFDTTQLKLRREATREYIDAMLYTADFAPSRHNLGIIYSNIGLTEKSLENYTKAIEIDDEFYPAKVNLAMLYNSQGLNDRALELLEEVIKQNPDLDEVYYSLGLLTAEMGMYEKAAGWLKEASVRIPERARIFYNLGLIQEYLQKFQEAEKALLWAYELEPRNPQYIYALAQFYVNRGENEKAEKYIKLIESN